MAASQRTCHRTNRQAYPRFPRLVSGTLAAAALLALLAGVPWALIRFVGWPLPDHVPSWTEIQDELLGPMTSGFLVSTIACLTWLVWTLFAVDVAHYAIDAARGVRVLELRAVRPTQRIASVLVGAVLISILGPRAGFAQTPHSGSGPQPVTTASAWNRPFDEAVRGAQRAASGAAEAPGTPAAAVAATGAKTAVVLPYDPDTGVHDSLWRMAERTLGDGSRWPEIYRLNKGKPQPHGGTLTRPSLVFPGEKLVLPDDATVPTAPPSQPRPAPSTTGPLAPTRPLPVESTVQPPGMMQPPLSTNVDDEPGVGWGQELFVGLGLASAVSAALAAARRRARRRYLPGSGDRRDLAVAPAVYRLLLAVNHHEVDGPEERPPRAPRQSVVLGRKDTTLDDEATALPVGLRNGREIALHVAAARGLGLLGRGASGALRALLVAALTTDAGTRVIVTAEALAALLGHRAPPTPFPARLIEAADLDAALNLLEAETLVRLGQRSLAGHAGEPIVLVASAPSRHSQRLQAVLENGAAVGVTGVLMGQWNPGVTAHVRDDGVISSTNPGRGEALRGTRVFRVAEDHAADLLALLHNAEAPEVDLPTDNRQATDEPERRRDRALEILGTASMRPSAARPASTCIDCSLDRASSSVGPPHSPSVPMRISVLGPPRVWWRSAANTDEVVKREVTAAFQPRLRELLVFLALHPDGASREALIAALWPSSAPEKTTNAMNTSFSRLRRAVTAATEGALSDVVLLGEGRFRLDPTLVEVDYWPFASAVAARRTAATDHERVEAYRRVVVAYRGPLADGMITEWIETAREAIRRDAIDAVAALARALVQQDPQQTLDLLEIARSFDPHNELIYRDIMRLQERLGQLDAIPRTLTLLTTRLAEVDERPTPRTFSLAERLRSRHDAGETHQPFGADRGHVEAG